MGVEARCNSHFMRLIADAMAKSNTCLILIQQTREAIGKMGGDPTVVSGGKAIPFFAHVRIRITRSKLDRELQQNIMKFTIIKNKMSAPYKIGTVVYKWGVGFDFFSEIADLAIEFGIIKKEKASYFFPECNDLKLVGEKKAIQYLADNVEYTKAVIEPLVLKYLAENTGREDETFEHTNTETLDDNE
jgi:recombination protein RecA